MSQKVLLNQKEVNIILHRLACQLIEKHNDFSNTILVGLQPRGKFLAYRLKALLQSDYDIANVQIGCLDITFYRDDFRRSNKVLQASTNEMDCVVEGRNVVFVDDVLYTVNDAGNVVNVFLDKQFLKESKLKGTRESFPSFCIPIVPPV